jgi:hypothetical protein
MYVRDDLGSDAVQCNDERGESPVSVCVGFIRVRGMAGSSAGATHWGSAGRERDHSKRGLLEQAGSSSSSVPLRAPVDLVLPRRSARQVVLVLVEGSQPSRVRLSIPTSGGGRKRAADLREA